MERFLTFFISRRRLATASRWEWQEHRYNYLPGRLWRRECCLKFLAPHWESVQTVSVFSR